MEATAQLSPTPIPLDTLLNLKQMFFRSGRSDSFFYATPLVSQRLATLHRMVGGRSQIIMVTGEKGSGKSSLIHRYLATSDRSWRSGRIRLKTKHRAAVSLFNRLNCCRVFLSDGPPRPSIIIDNAHHLSPREIKALLQWTYPASDEPRLQSILLVADVQMRKRYAEIEAYLPPQAGIDKIDMAPLTEKQTADYLDHRIKTAGLPETIPFSDEHIRSIHHLSGGIPGLINREAYQLAKRLKSTPSNRSASRDGARPMLGKARRWFKRLGWQPINRQTNLDPTPWVP